MNAQFQTQQGSRQINLQKNIFAKNSAVGNRFASPTDNILSPCTQKLTAHKAKFLEKTKATKLDFSDLE